MSKGTFPGGHFKTCFCKFCFPNGCTAAVCVLGLFVQQCSMLGLYISTAWQALLGSPVHSGKICSRKAVPDLTKGFLTALDTALHSAMKLDPVNLSIQACIRAKLVCQEHNCRRATRGLITLMHDPEPGKTKKWKAGRLVIPSENLVVKTGT